MSNEIITSKKLETFLISFFKEYGMQREFENDENIFLDDNHTGNFCCVNITELTNRIIYTLNEDATMKNLDQKTVEKFEELIADCYQKAGSLLIDETDITGKERDEKIIELLDILGDPMAVINDKS